MPRKGTKPTPEKEQDERGEQGKNDASRVSGPRPFWSGTITFGLVSLPVGLYPATRSKPVSLRMIDQDGTPLARRYFCEKEGRTLRNDELVRGYEFEKNEFIVVEDRELEELSPEKSQEIDLKRFVSLSEIDPMYFERAYFLTPEKGITKAYRLLAKSMEESQRAGIATFVMRGKEYLVAIIAEKGILRAETLRFHEEIRTPESVGLSATEQPGKALVSQYEKAMKALFADTLERSALEDLHSQRIMERVNDKLERGEGVINAISEPDNDIDQGGDVVDLMQVLKQSLEQGRSPADQPAQKSRSREKRGSSEPETESRRSGQRRTSRKPAAKQSRQGSLADLSRNELYEKAQELGIPGRSSMSKEQLIRAIEHAA